jgi:hypothetical protein
MDCAPQGLGLGADHHMIIGCNAGSAGSKIPPLTAVFDIATEKVIASTPKMGGSDMAGYVEKLGLYVVGGRESPGGPSIALLGAKTNEWIQNIRHRRMPIRLSSARPTVTSWCRAARRAGSAVAASWCSARSSRSK